MCVRSVRPPEKRISRCLPCASHALDRRGRRSACRRRRAPDGARPVAKRVTTVPASARCSAAAARAMVSPSGIRAVASRAPSAPRRVRGGRTRRPGARHAQLQATARDGEAGLDEVAAPAGSRWPARRSAPRPASRGVRPARPRRGAPARAPGPGPAPTALGLVVGHGDQQLPIAACQSRRRRGRRPAPRARRPRGWPCALRRSRHVGQSTSAP